MSWRFVCSLGLLAVISLTSYGLLRHRIAAQEATGVVVNIAGKQRMLSQRAPRLLLEILAAPDAESEEARRNDLRAAIMLMREDHRALVDGDSSRGVPGTYSDEVADVYRDGRNLDQRVMAYLATLEELASEPKVTLGSSSKLGRVLNDSRKDILADLNDVVKLRESDSEAGIASLLRWQSALLIAFLTALGAIGLFQFQPMVARIHAQFAALHASQRDMTLVLENSHDGLVLAGPDGALHPTRSQAAVNAFGEIAPGAKLWDYLFSDKTPAAERLRLGWEQIADDFLPIEVALGQLPRRIERGGKTFELDYTPAQAKDSEAVEFVLVSLRDVTAMLELEAIERRAQDVQAFVRFTVQDRSGAKTFAREMNRLIAGLLDEGRTQKELQRDLHTIKGNAAIYGLRALSSCAHRLEDRVHEDPEVVSLGRLHAELIEEWNILFHEVEILLDESKHGVYLSDDEYETFCLQIQQVGADELADVVRTWRMPRVLNELERLERLVHGLAAQLQREVEVVTEDNGLRLVGDGLDAFWSALVHAICNAVDHGIEGPDERVAAGKSPVGHVTLSVEGAEGWLELSVCDDGRGIDVDAVRARATETGVDLRGDEDLLELLTIDGFSSKSEVTATSGRGVGATVLLEETSRLGGEVEVQTEVGQGTTWRFRLPYRDHAVQVPQLAGPKCRGLARMESGPPQGR